MNLISGFTKCRSLYWTKWPVWNTRYWINNKKNDFNSLAITYESERKVTAFLKKHPFKILTTGRISQIFYDAFQGTLRAYPFKFCFLDLPM